MSLNPELIKQARARIKRAFVPSDPAMGGAPPGGDPSGGGAPPPDAGGMAPGGDPGAGGAPPDPSMMGGPPPGGDPSGGAPPPPPGPPPDAGVGGAPPGGDIAAQVSQGVSQALASSGLQGNKSQTAPKPDINTIATDVFQMKQMLVHSFKQQGIELPPNILNGPNRDPVTGAPAMGPTGGSDAQPGASMQPGGGQQSAIQPVQPMQGAFPSGGGGGKTASDAGRRIGEEITGPQLMSKAAAVAMMLRRKRVA